MIPYGTFTFFLIAFIVLIPVIILGFLGKRSYIYNGISTAIMIVIIFASDKHNLLGQKYLSAQLFCFIIYVIWQVALIMYYYQSRQRKNTFTKFVTIMVLSILPLAIVKILQSSWLGGHQIHFHESKLIEFVGFLGISYVTFKSVQLIMEIRDGSIKEIKVGKLIQFISFFPTISSGPIDRYKRFVKDDKKVPSGAEYREFVIKAIHMIMLGFLYKYIIAYLIQTYAVNPLQLNLHGFTHMWLYMYAYSLYLFFDFAGYSLFAIAVSYLYGIKTPPNFKQPFKAKNIKDFWNRWHMTLSFWFRDCIYMRSLFYMSRKKLLKSQFAMSNVAFFLNFFIMGVWHGLEVYYIVYGLYHAALFIGYGYYERWRKKHPPRWQNGFTTAISIIITFHFVTFGFLIFSGKFI
ncbi:membrane protein involved in D-alanine export [Staphylococcus epidermidis]|uniref:D-alanyl-lipoteichoic acid biosynthesis protein DltB n=1 Tax=Staphylococcus epidermidis TaxID=1282 RepID=UPI00039BC177|nr:D-alanyl-lipoteichoic acid biosynthesis protein DltB [Staphylococcus epidermidis]ATQ50279.1 D-alanyl-lipoteichoic acid biosynthesis protein DltB [Staphylococcus epidermidis]KEI47134.1 D-alanine transfer protein DltB [Staphylococcus epidermidis UC7032]MBM0827662.1 D-alanyl-lipoteichoic acid biosynthesis protein DltB [Staphylococcus epidermidis]MCG1615260.1 D-alanyl-lipoteichoic acid biosynthesis protein DltB [Staphylococcus epidermidis]MCG1637938.1 D-alanyl-lipoteichoic acid biosynthesis pro